MANSPDVVVVGAGVFGAWTAYQLRGTGRSVTLVDAHGPGNTRAASGGESRVIRIGYGGEAIYSRWALQSFDRWRTLLREAGRPLLVRTGVLWLGRDDDALTDATTLTLQRLGVPVELLSATELTARFPQFRLGSITRGVLEPESGVILARRAVQTVVRQAVRHGVNYRHAAVTAPDLSNRRLERLETSAGPISAGTYVFACGGWLGALFPRTVGPLLHVTRQEVFFFGGAPGDQQLSPPDLPAWVDFREGVYGLPDLEGRGVKIGLDRHGSPFDPETGERLPSPGALLSARRLAATRLPALRDARLLDARVCQYSNTSTGDFLIDRHPDVENIWLVGGGSGHGFKHGPAVGEYVAARLAGRGGAEPRFTLETKGHEPGRKVF